MTIDQFLLLLPAFVFGAFIGSFLNVCIHRLPRNESVVSPPSRCYACGTRVLWYDNIPVLSWLLLRGLRTLFVRVDRASRTAMAVARHLEGHPAISEVCYPGLPGFPGD